MLDEIKLPNDSYTDLNTLPLRDVMGDDGYTVEDIATYYELLDSKLELLEAFNRASRNQWEGQQCLCFHEPVEWPDGRKLKSVERHLKKLEVLMQSPGVLSALGIALNSIEKPAIFAEGPMPSVFLKTIGDHCHPKEAIERAASSRFPVLQGVRIETLKDIQNAINQLQTIATVATVATGVDGRKSNGKNRDDLREAAWPLQEYWAETAKKDAQLTYWGDKSSPATRFLYDCLSLLDPATKMSLVAKFKEGPPD